MRLCQDNCGEAADLWYHGPWAAECALRRYGKDMITLEARFGELRREVARPSAERRPGPSSVPVLESGASVAASVVASQPPALSFDELTDILDREHDWIEA